MARLYSIGFELDSVTSGVEMTTHNSAGGTASTISSTVANSGTYSDKFTTTGSGFSTDVYEYSTGAGVIFVRAYVYFTGYPGTNCSFLALTDASTSYTCGAMYMNSSGKIGIEWYTGSNVQNYGTNLTAAISLNAWHYIELKVDTSTTEVQIVTGKVDGVQIDSQTGSNTSVTANQNVEVYWGVFGESSEGGAIAATYFDDIVINDNTGSFQNTFAGPGHLLRYSPNAAGDSNTFATNVGGTAGTSNNYTRINEVTPNNATSYNASITAASDLFAVGAVGGSLPAGSTINVVQVGGVIANITGADTTASLQFQAEQTSGGTIAKSAAVIPDTTTWTTNNKTAPKNYPLTLYQDPTSTNWTTSTIASMQIGYLVDFSHTDALGISTVWAYVDYTPSSAVNASVTQVGATLTFTGGTQTVTSIQDVSVAQSAATLTLTGGTQSVSGGSIVNASVTQVGASITLTGGTQVAVSVQDVAITQSHATLTFTGGTQAVASVQDVQIAQVGAVITFTGGTQSVATINDVAVSQVGANLTLSGGTQVVAVYATASVSQSAATLTFTGGTQTIATINDVSIAQSAVTITLTGGTQAVATVQIVSISQVGASITFTGGSQSTALNVSQTHATLTLTGGSQTTALNLPQSAATLTLTGGTQSIATVNDVAISQVGATVTLSGGTQTVTTFQQALISQVRATLTLSGGTQSIVAIIVANASITQAYAVLTLTGGTQSIAAIVISKANTWTPEVIYPDSWSSIGDPNPDTWLVNPQGVIDTWDNANREWDSDYTWDGTTSQVTNAIISSWTGSEAVASNWQSEPVSTSSWTEV
jgi:hypothetical protein